MIGAVIQARMTSTRFPGKMAVDLNNYPLIEWVIRRVMLSEKIDKIILAIIFNFQILIISFILPIKLFFKRPGV